MASRNHKERKVTSIMVAIFTTASGLDDIVHSDKESVWQNIIMKLGEVFIDSEIDIPVDEEDPLFILDQAIKIDVSKKDFIKEIENTPSYVLKEPCGIYLLSISIEKAKEIQNSYGVICRSLYSMEHTLLTQKGADAELVEKQQSKTWSDIFKKFKLTPTNSALIIDAHLFENDSYDKVANCYDKTKNYGLRNLSDILDQILPKSFGDVYHVGVLLTNTDEAKKGSRSRTTLTNDQIASAINKLKRGLNRSYEICMEVIFFSPLDSDNHKLIHNRKILTNTYILDAPYKLAAFDKGVSRASQTISISPLFELIHIDSDSDMKEKRLRYDIDSLGRYVQLQCTAHPTGILYKNGQKTSFNEIQHRFLTKMNSTSRYGTEQ